MPGASSMRRCRLVAMTLLVSLMVVPIASSNDKISARQREFFENKIRPVLVKHCYSCHSAQSDDLGGKLRLDTKPDMLKGGESGPSMVPGKPDLSLLIQALKYDGVEMPPDKPLPPAVINDFVTWVKQGAPDPRQPKTKAKKPAKHVGKGPTQSTHWSLQPIRDPKLPKVRDPNWARDPIDRFILAKMENAKLRPTHHASPRALIRRLSIDLLGLPPTANTIKQFEKDYQELGQQAVERWVDRFLASPRFGERWGRHWLDVVRFGESNGNDGLGRNPTFPHAWRYRDYVIQSFNDDVPYQRFLTEQIAGDLLPAKTDRQRDRQLVATGMLALGSKPAKAMNVNFDMDVVADQINVVSKGMMGLSVACARCHDHKHDPIPTRDYYALAGIFKSTQTLWGEAAYEKLTAPRTPLHVLKSQPTVPPPALGVSEKIKDLTGSLKGKAPPKPQYRPGTPLAMGVRDAKKPADCKINIRGESKKLGPAVPRGFLSACQLDDTSFSINPKQSGRLQLAQWMTHPKHPLTARVYVNRVWLHLFGQALVNTPDDFGIYGARPSHPQLLDHLATRFQQHQGSTKKLIRAIVLSRTYQLSSSPPVLQAQADPNNQFYTHHLRRRLDAETLRDSMLQATGELESTPPVGSPIRHLDLLVNLAGDLHQPSRHRSIYLCYLRNAPPPELAAFDLPEAIDVAGKRNITTLPTQALYLLNSPFVVDQSRKMADRLLHDSTLENDRQRLQFLFQNIHARQPSAQESQSGLAFIKQVQSQTPPDFWRDNTPAHRAWAGLCQALLVTNEFRYVD